MEIKNSTKQSKKENNITKNYIQKTFKESVDNQVGSM
jgi:hypothetical protein